MKIDRAKGAQVGDGNTQHNTYLPPQRATRHHTRDSPSMTVTAGDGATVTTTQKNTQLKFSIPVIGPLISVAVTHPVIAAVTAVVVVGGTGVAAGGALSSSGSPSTKVVRGFPMRVNQSGPPIGYDFSQNPPTIAGSTTPAIYASGSLLTSTTGKLAAWNNQTLPSADDCRAAIAHGAVREVAVGPTTLVCYLDQNGDPGYISVTAYDGQSLTIDTAHLQ